MEREGSSADQAPGSAMSALFDRFPLAKSILGASAYSLPALTAALYLMGSVGYSQYLSEFELPAGSFSQNIEQTMVLGFTIGFWGLRDLPESGILQLGFLIAVGYVVLSAMETFNVNGRVRKPVRSASTRPRFLWALGHLHSALLTFGWASLAMSAVLLVVLIAPVLATAGGKAWAKHMQESIAKSCQDGDRCIRFGNEANAAQGRLIASSATHVAIGIPVSGEILLLSMDGELVATSR